MSNVLFDCCCHYITQEVHASQGLKVTANGVRNGLLSLQITRLSSQNPVSNISRSFTKKKVTWLILLGSPKGYDNSTKLIQLMYDI